MIRLFLYCRFEMNGKKNLNDLHQRQKTMRILKKYNLSRKPNSQYLLIFDLQDIVRIL